MRVSLRLALCRDFFKTLIGEVDFSTSPMLQYRKNCVEIHAFLATNLLSNSRIQAWGNLLVASIMAAC
jgi:hypothetical protein